MAPWPSAVSLLSLATAQPTGRLNQAVAAEVAQRIFESNDSEISRLLPVFANAGIESRAVAAPLEWLARPHGWRERQERFMTQARILAQQALRSCLDQAGLGPEEITGLVVACSTGSATPSLESYLIEDLGFRADLERLPIFGLGCAGGVLGLSRTAALARSRPGCRYLFLSLELCSLTFRPGDQSNSNIVATALFGDGAAAALLSTEQSTGARLTQGGEHTWPGSSDIMGWDVCDDGLGVRFSKNIPRLVLQKMRAASDHFLAGQGLQQTDLQGIIPHPGGEKVLNALAKVYDGESNGIKAARQVLRQHGNMSGPTVLFVLEQLLQTGLSGRHLMTALGPGFTAAFQLIERA